jgi:hypothetical protein
VVKGRDDLRQRRGDRAQQGVLAAIADPNPEELALIVGSIRQVKKVLVVASQRAKGPT